jgi:hypothetical protein
MVRISLLSVALLSSLISYGQFNNHKSWSYSLYVGASNMVGDLGGSDVSNGTAIQDIDLRATRPAIGVSLQRHVGRVTFVSNLFVTQLVGNDAFTSLKGRNQRNLSVRTDLVELNAQAELYPFSARSKLNGFYINAGVGGIYFQPKAKYEDTWYKLRPLGTEGQNYIAGMQPYKTFSVVIPFGYGYKFPVGRFTTLKVDVGLRKTFTDYLDDVSTVYADPAQLAESSGAMAATLADRSTFGYEVGSQRGGAENKDAYFMVGIKLARTLGSKKFDDCTNFEIPLHRSRIR